MAEDSISDPTVPNSDRFQFRLHSIFILMAIVAFSAGLVPVWYRNVIVPKSLPRYLRHDFSNGLNKDWPSQRQLAIINADRYAPGFSLIAIAGCLGLWFAYLQPTKRISDIWLGLAFGLSLFIVMFPPLIGWVYGHVLIEIVVSYDIGSPGKQLLIYYVLCLAAIYSCWLLFLKRYLAAILLFLYRCLYGWFAVMYLANMIS